MRLKNKIVLLTSAQHPCTRTRHGICPKGRAAVSDEDAISGTAAAGPLSAGTWHFSSTCKISQVEVVRRTVASSGVSTLLNCSGITTKAIS
jgi:hypothetical protein